jgi:DNA-binding transcriptional MerR regulator
MTIEALASAASESIETVLLCEREGLLGEATFDRRGRRYDARALAVLRLMRLGQRLGVDLEEIKAALPMIGDPRKIRTILREWAEARLARIAREQRELRRAHGLLCGFVARSAAAEPAVVHKVSRELARLNRDLAASERARPANGGAPVKATRAPRSPPVSRGGVSGGGYDALVASADAAHGQALGA